MNGTSVFYSPQPQPRQFFARLTADERAALITLAARERRDPRDQAAILIRRALLDLGLIQTEQCAGVITLDHASAISNGG